MNAVAAAEAAAGAHTRVELGRRRARAGPGNLTPSRLHERSERNDRRHAAGGGRGPRRLFDRPRRVPGKASPRSAGPGFRPRSFPVSRPGFPKRPGRPRGGCCPSPTPGRTPVTRPAHSQRCEPTLRRSRARRRSCLQWRPAGAKAGAAPGDGGPGRQPGFPGPPARGRGHADVRR